MGNYIDKFSTVTGYKLMNAIQELKRILPPRAYKQVGNNDRLTDISPAYLTDVATKVFGPIGIGWYYSHGEVTVTEGVTSKGKPTYTADIDYFDLFYLYVDEHGATAVSFPIRATGSSTNSDRGHAVRGALTNAIGAAFAKLCWQLLTYKGVVTHNNAAGWYEKQKERDAEKPGDTDNDESEEHSAPAEDTDVVHNDEPVNGESEEEVAVEEEPAPEEQLEPEPEKETNPKLENLAEVYASPPIKKAYETVVLDSIGVPMPGKTLQEVANSGAMGEKVLTYLSGERKHAKTGENFVPQGKEQLDLKKAAILVLGDLRSKGTVSKSRSKAASK